MGQDLAVPRGVDAAARWRDLDAAHDRFLSTGDAGPELRDLVVDSWARSLASGLDPERALAAIRLTDDALDQVRAAHPLTSVMPVIRRLLVEDAADAGLLVAVSDAAGQLLYVEGAAPLVSRAEAMHFMPGADWSEASAGTNAPGTALALGRPVQLLGPEHLSRQVTPWSCSAAPIHDPVTGAMLGVLDVTGGAEVATPHALALVRATAAAAEAELQIARLRSARPERSRRSTLVGSGWSRPRLDVLGRNRAVLTHGSSTTRLPLRASEVLLVLASAPDGMSGAELAEALGGDAQVSVTMRVEISRVRSLIAPLQLTSRPYRLAADLDSDVTAVRTALHAGQLRRAVAAYPGPVLPHSEAPAVAQVRDDLHAEIRSSVLASTDPDAVLSFADTPHGRQDYAVWAHALEVLPTSSPRHPQVREHLTRLDVELG